MRSKKLKFMTMKQAQGQLNCQLNIYKQADPHTSELTDKPEEVFGGQYEEIYTQPECAL